MFSRKTILEACQSFQFLSHTGIDSLMLQLELDYTQVGGGNKEARCNELFRYLQNHPDEQIDGRPRAHVAVEEAVRQALGNRYRLENGTDAALFRSLERDGFVIEDGQLRPALPGEIDLPAADDEVHLLLNRYGLTTSLGHLDQAIDAHARGNWASANAQIRTFYESLFDEIAVVVDPANAPNTQTGETRRQLLANLPTPFLMTSLNEWSTDGKNFTNGVFKRLHPQGSHPGLSDEEDSTFRLHLVLLVSRILLRRLDTVKGGRP